MSDKPRIEATIDEGGVVKVVIENCNNQDITKLIFNTLCEAERNGFENDNVVSTQIMEDYYASK